ncbi:hypothetical protein LAZ67_9003405, partial [Cordylochernes scorpioides]
MELPLVNVSTCELRSVIRFFTAKNETAVNIHRNLVSVYGEGCMSIQMVRRWRSWFLEGRQNVHDERSGSPVTATDNAAVAAVRNMVEADRRVTIDEIMIRLPPGIEIGRSSIGKIMLDVLNFRKVCARWVPRLLSENHKQQRMEAARAFLEMHRRDGDQLFSRIVTGDESWVHHSTPETKRQSMAWKKPEERAPKKAKVTIAASKVTAIVFWDCKGVLLVDYLPPNTTVNAARYCEVLTKLRAAIKRKRPGLLSRKVLLVLDNVRPHAAQTTQTLLENFKWEIFTHPPYSPDLPQATSIFSSTQSARWVPRLLLENHNQQRMEAARAFLEMHQRDGDQLFSRIVTEDESWVHHSTPGTKRQRMVWKKPEESAPKKAKVTISAGKVMAMENFKWEIFTHPPYSPELTPSDYYLFPALKWHLGGKHFANDDKVQAEENHWLRRQDT